MPILKDQTPERRLAVVLKYAGIVSALVGILLIMQMFKVLTWWTALILCVILGLLLLARRQRGESGKSGN
jgi:uncharacterized membrane protein YqgA involved in biofilm formation